MMEEIYSSETSLPTTATRRNIAEDCIPHSRRRENFRSYIAFTVGLCSGDVMCLLLGTYWVFINQKTALFIVTAVKTSDLI
jgi:hypothetical protein